MKIIRTVLGDILNTDIGITNAHDHLIRSGGPEVFRDPSFLMDNVTMAVKEFERWINAGGRTILCMDPIGCGRNVDKMLQVSNAYKDRGNIIMVTGFHKAINYCPNTSFLATAPVEQLAELTIKEITDNCGVSKRTFYHYFQDKCELVLYEYADGIRSIINKK